MNRALKKYPAVRAVVRLFAGNMSVEEEHILDQQRHGSPEFQQDFLATAQVLAAMQPLADDPDIRTIIDESPRVGTAERLRGQWPKLAVAASLLLGIVAVFSSYWQYKAPLAGNQNVVLYITRVGEQKTVTLADGSTLSLNTGTQLLVDISGEKRRVILERGEAYFEVANDPVRPFTVELGTRSVSVLGTQFNILRSPEKITLAVVEGSVAVHPSGEHLLPDALELGEQVTPFGAVTAVEQYRVQAGWVAEYDIAKNRTTGFKPGDMEHLYSWRNGVLRFTNQPLVKVVQELNRYGGKKILIEDETIMSLPIYAVLRIDRLDSGLTGLERGYPIRVIRHFDRTVIVGADEK